MPTTALNPATERLSFLLVRMQPLRAVIEFLSHQLTKPVAGPINDGHPVVIFPGLATDGSAVAPLRADCQALGHDVVDWGKGCNTGPKGDVETWLSGPQERVSPSLSRFPLPLLTPTDAVPRPRQAANRLPREHRGARHCNPLP